MAFSLAHCSDISYECDDWVLVEYEGKLFPGEIIHVINNQSQL